MRADRPETARIEWVDYAKGFCIVLVVMMHSTLGVEAATGREGWLHAVVAFAKPFRMPDFFLISGLFLARVIGRDWRTYLDRKVVHFAYFYGLWVTIQFVFKAPAIVMSDGPLRALALYLDAFVQPFGTLWFIYLLPIFFVVMKLTRHVSPAAIWLFGAALEIAPIETGSVILDEFASRFVYFYTGYVLAPWIFRLAEQAQRRVGLAALALAVWAPVNAIFVATGWSDWPLVSLALGLLGAGAVVAASALMARAHLFGFLRYCGQHSIVVYLAFFLPMAAARTVLLKSGLIADIGTVSALVTIAGVLGALIWFALVRETRLKFLFERPAAFWIAPKRVRLQPAE